MSDPRPVSDRRLRVLIITKIFPNVQQPHSSVFNRYQFEELAKTCDVDLLALIPTFPGARFSPPSSLGAKLVDVPARARLGNLDVSHPRVWYLPALGRPIAGMTYAASLLPVMRGRFGSADVVLGCFTYPDGFAAAVWAKLLRLPLVIKAHGSDINAQRHLPLIRPQLSWTLRQAAACVAPSKALCREMIALGAPASATTYLRNGVDQSQFFPRDRATCRAALGIEPDVPLAVFVGRVGKSKGCDDLVKAFGRVNRELPKAQLVLIGDGELEHYRNGAKTTGANIDCLGRQSREQVAMWVGASNVVTLPSHAEGTPNVLIEALASGRRVVASRVGGIPDLVHDPGLGVLVAAGDVAALAASLADALKSQYDPQEVVKLARLETWPQSAARLRSVLASVLDNVPACDSPEAALDS